MSELKDLEREVRTEVKEINEKLTKVQITLEGLNVKVGSLQTNLHDSQKTKSTFFLEIFKWCLMIVTSITCGIFGHKVI